MRRYPLAAAVLIITLALAACEPAPESGVEVYYVDTSGRAGPLQPVVLPLEESDIRGIAAALGAPPPSAGTNLVSGIENISCSGYALDGQDLTLTLSIGYAGLDGLDLTVANACLVMTFTALPQVDRVCVQVEGGAKSEYMTADLFLPDDTITPMVAEYNLFFIDEMTGELAVENRRFIIRESAGVERCLFDELLKADSMSGRIPVLPPKTRLVSHDLANGTLTLILSQDFTEGEPSEPRMAILYIRGLVESMCALEDVERVRLMVEYQSVDRALTSYGGAELPEYLTPEAVSALG